MTRKPLPINLIKSIDRLGNGGRRKSLNSPRKWLKVSSLTYFSYPNPFTHSLKELEVTTTLKINPWRMHEHLSHKSSRLIMIRLSDMRGKNELTFAFKRGEEVFKKRMFCSRTKVVGNSISSLKSRNWALIKALAVLLLTRKSANNIRSNFFFLIWNYN